MPRSAGVAAFAACALVSALWTLVAGKDVNWDLLNYHYYAPYELLAGRLTQDFFAASAQSYLNPLGYIPFYLMVASGWHSVGVSALLAAVHSLSLGLLYAIAWRLFAHLPRRERIAMACLGSALGAASAVFWATVGTSFLDPLLAPLMLAALLLLLTGNYPFAAGLLFGAASALKYSNAIFALAALPLALLAGRRAALAYIGGGALAVAVLAGPWIALMTREFGDPFYPGLTGGGGRFAPHEFLAALMFPFRMALLERSLYSETFAPDLRFAALALLALALPVFRKNVGAWKLLGFFALAYVAWLATSANARYGLVLLLLAGVCVAYLAERVLPARIARVALGALLALQLVAAMIAAPARWFIAEPWSKRWFPYEVPRQALHEPALYLSLETQPMAVVAPLLHPASSFVNVRGQHSIAADSPRLAALVARHPDRVRVIGREPGGPAYAGTLERLGYRLDPTDCFTVAWRPDDADPVSRAANWLSGTPPSSEPLSVASCALAKTPRDPMRVQAERQASALFDRIEKACPRLFRGQTAVTEAFGVSGWARHYVDLDARIEAFGGRVVLNRYRAGEIVDLAHCR